MVAAGLNGDSANHAAVKLNILSALHTRLGGADARRFGTTLGIDTTDREVRVVSPSSAPIDRVMKLRMYAAVATITRYGPTESQSVAVTVVHLRPPEENWTAVGLGPDDVLQLPVAGMSVPVAEIHDGVLFPIEQASEPDPTWRAVATLSR